MAGLKIREAGPADVPALMALLWELASWENLTNRFCLTGERLSCALFEERVARAAIAHITGEPVAMSLYYPHFATFTGRTSLYVEELVVSETFRDKGVGHDMMAYLARLALREGFYRLELPCMLNNPSALAFYERLGAELLSDRVSLRLSLDALKGLGGEDK